MDDSIDPVTNTSLQKKKSKKKKKKIGGKNESDVLESPNSDVQEKQPQQTTDRDETIMRTTKCSYCGKSVRQLLRGFKNPEAVIPGPVVCEVCLKTISQQKEEYKPYTEAGEKRGSAYRLTRKQPSKETLCNCVACVSKRDNTVNPDLERDAHITQSYWMEIRHIVRCIYRENMRLSTVTTRENIGSEKMRTIVRKLCCRDPHQFFQRLETLAREYLLEVKVRLLEQLSCGFNSPQLAIEFIQMLLNEYSSLCAALPALLYLLEPLEETEYVQQLGVTIELVNKNIFRELIFAESFMSSNLPLIIAQLRLASLSSDPFHRSTADELSQRYNSLDDEMDMIGSVWNSAKDQLKQQQEESKKKEERRAHIEKILSDGESFKKQAKKDQQHQGEVYVTTSVQASEKTKEDSSINIPQSVPCEATNHKLSLHPSSNQSSIPSTHFPTITTTSLSTKHLPTEEIVLEEENWLSKEQVSEWSKILFKCIKPIGDPEFRITENIATHTITLKIDMTTIDLQHAESVCTHEQVKKYEELGMRREEIAEVALKLNAIKHLGINLRIDDLFDEHGFVIVDGSDYHEEREDAVYFVEEGKNSVKGKEKLMEDEVNRSGLVDLQTEKERVIHREKKEMGEGRETDLLQSMTMKIRFMKSVSDEDTRSRLMSNSEQVMFESCDQVQMKLTQLELNTMRLMCTNKCLASNLGIRKRKPNDSITTEERFVHTDAHQPFVGLLLEQGKQAEQLKRDKEERKALTAASSKDVVHPKVVEGCEVDTPAQSTAVKVPEQVTDKRDPGGVTKSSDVCIPSQTRSCQCFACIGAVAAQITEGSFHPLNPVDPSGSRLSIKGTMAAKLHSVENCEGNTEHHKESLSTKSVSNKAEHVWQNWMSTSEISHTPQQDNSHTPLSPDDHALPNSDHASPDHPPINPSSNNGSDAGSSDVPHSASSLSSEGTTNINGGAVTCTNEDHQHHHSESHKNGGPVKRYCPCCYCELFGQNTPTVPTSHNYTKQRDKMRQKLEKKRKQDHVYCHHQHAHHHHHHEEPPPHSPVDIHQEHQHHYHHHHHHHHPNQEHSLPTPSPPPPTSIPAQANVGNSVTTTPLQKQEKSLDEILMFIEGKDFNGSSAEVTSTVGSSKAKKKKKGKKKSEQESVSNGHHVLAEPNGTGKKGRKDEGKQHTSLHQNGGPPLQKKGYNSQNPVSLKTSGKLNSPKQSQRKANRSGGQSNGLMKSSGRSDSQHTLDNNLLSEADEDYDKELEDFKKLCFSSAPVETRKKIHVSLNMQDILSKIK